MSKAVSGPFGSVAAPSPPFWTLGHRWPSWNPEVWLSLTLGWSDIQAASPAAVTLRKSHCGGPRTATVHSDCSFKPLRHVYNFNNRCNFKNGAKQPTCLVLIPRPVYCLPRSGPLPHLSTLLACPHLGPWKLPSLAAPSVFTGLWSSALLVTQFWPRVTMASRRLPPPPREQRCLLTARALRPAAPRHSPEDLQANTEPGHHQCLPRPALASLNNGETLLLAEPHENLRTHPSLVHQTGPTSQ